MIALPTGTQIWIAAGVTDLRRGFTGLSATIQTALKENPFSGHVFVFRSTLVPGTVEDDGEWRGRLLHCGGWED